MDNENSVCFVAKISEISPIIGADKIELAKCGQWSSIVAKNTHKIDDLVVCLTTDAVLPQEFAEKHGIVNYLRKGNRIRTIKLKGVYSECILINYSAIPEKMGYHGNIEKYNPEGTDLMATFNIFKYEEPIKQIQLSNGRKYKYKANPNFHIYYKFPNIKNVPDIFDEEDEVVITRKIHGSNWRGGIVKKNKLSIWDRIKKLFTNDKWIEYTWCYGSHMMEKGSDSQGYYDEDVWRKISDEYDIKNKLWEYVKFYTTPEQIGSGIILYGEVYGPGIQKGYDYGLKDIQLALFDVELNGEYVDDDSFQFFIDTLIKSPKVEYLYKGKWSKKIQEQYSKTEYIKGTNIPHEGIVIKHVNGDKIKRAKIVSPDYLIYNEKTNGTDFH